MTSAQHDLELINLTKGYGDTIAVDAIDHVIPPGLLCLPARALRLRQVLNACRMIAGHESVTGGAIVLARVATFADAAGARHGDDVPDLRAVPASERARQRRLQPEDEGRTPPSGRAAGEMLGLVDMRVMPNGAGTAFGRPAAARGAGARPDHRSSILLLDEPLSALDPFLRVRMRGELHKLQRELGITFIHVTHSQEEALALADLIVVMNDGVIEQSGTPREVFDAPKTEFVARFIGGHNISAPGGWSRPGPTHAPRETPRRGSSRRRCAGRVPGRRRRADAAGGQART